MNPFVWIAAAVGTLAAPLVVAIANPQALDLVSPLAWLSASALPACAALWLARPARDTAAGAAAALAFLLTQDAPMTSTLQVLALCAPPAALASAAVLIVAACFARAAARPGAVAVGGNAQAMSARTRETPVYAPPRRQLRETAANRALPHSDAKRVVDARKQYCLPRQEPARVSAEVLRAFAVFGFSQPVSPEAVRRAWRRRVSTAHPDRHAGADALCRQRAHEETVRLNAALEYVLRWHGQP